MSWRCVGRQPSAACPSLICHLLPVLRQPPRIPACTPRSHDVAEGPTTTTPARCAARRCAARSLAAHISTGSTRTRDPKPPRRENSVLVDPHPECESVAGCARAAGQCTAVSLSCSSSSASMQPLFFTNITNTCKLRIATLGSTHRRWPHLQRVDGFLRAEPTCPRVAQHCCDTNCCALVLAM